VVVHVDLLKHIFQKILMSKNANQMRQFSLFRAENRFHYEVVYLTNTVEIHHKCYEVNLRSFLTHQWINHLFLIFSMLGCHSLDHALWQILVGEPTMVLK
jgi:hypothetical protein